MESLSAFDCSCCYWNNTKIMSMSCVELSMKIRDYSFNGRRWIYLQLYLYVCICVFIYFVHDLITDAITITAIALITARWCLSCDHTISTRLSFQTSQSTIQGRLTSYTKYYYNQYSSTTCLVIVTCVPSPLSSRSAALDAHLMTQICSFLSDTFHYYTMIVLVIHTLICT